MMGRVGVKLEREESCCWLTMRRDAEEEAEDGTLSNYKSGRN